MDVSGSAHNNDSDLGVEEKDEDELKIEKNQTIAKIEDLIASLTSSEDSSIKTETLTYVELLALYEKEKTCRIDMETNFQQTATEGNKQVIQNFKTYT